MVFFGGLLVTLFVAASSLAPIISGFDPRNGQAFLSADEEDIQWVECNSADDGC